MKIRIFVSLLLSMFGLSLFAQMPNTISQSDKVYGLSKFWQEVNYNFVYLNKVDRDQWDKDYRELISKVQETENDYEYYRLLQKFCATLKDGHTNIYLPDTIRNNLYKTYFGEYRLFMTNVDGKAIVTRINLSKKKEIPIGSEVIRVNGLETRAFIEKEVMPYISSSTDHLREDWGISNMFQAPKGTRFKVVFRLPNGKEKELDIVHEETTEQEVYPVFKDWQLLEFKWVDKGIAYLQLNSFGNPEINSLFLEKLPELYKAQKLIIDLRYNGGGNTNIGRDILQYFTEDTLLRGSKTQSRLHIPAFKAWGTWVKAKDTTGNSWATQAYLSGKDDYFHQFPYRADRIKLDAKRIVVPTAILIGHNTASAAEDFLIYTDNQPHMTTMGEPTFGSTGQPLMFRLPGGGSARVCTKKDTYPDGKEFVGYGILPDVAVKRSLEDFLKDKDPVLKEAIKYLKSK